ncbi:MAG: cupredoxin domain-containing protein [Thermoproteota archaeon]|nr:cupredoxin domain-containing protein [Thermoproteota archaeon]
MVWKIVVISIAIVFGSMIIGGAIIAASFVTSIPDFDNENNNDVRSQSSNSGQDSSSLPAIEGAIRILDNEGNNSYTPNPTEVKVGEVVTWVNEDSAIHTATSTDGTFDSDILRRGQTYNHTFNSVGEYSHFCKLHPDMVGRVIVTQ